MTLSKLVRDTVKGIGSIPVAGPFLRNLAGGKLNLRHRLPHPIDRDYGVDTSGYVAKEGLVADKDLATKINPYMGIQPSAVRRALNTLPDLKSYVFMDLGCGKGRPTIVASEFPLQKIIGIEISSKLAEAAQKNAAIMARKHPARTKIEIIEGDAVNFPIPGRKLIIFLYNPFGPELMQQLVKNIERALQEQVDHLYVVYHNPVSGQTCDASSALKRWYAGHQECDPSERGFGIEKESATVIWQSVKNALPSPHANAGRRIVVAASNFNTSLD